MKLTVIQSIYLKNKLIPTVLIKNLTALFESGIDFQYILYNDNGDKDIITDILFYLEKIKNKNLEKYKKYRNAFEYVYSEINYGKGIDSGALVGAIPYIKGELIHQIGQDDIFTKDFYIECTEKLKNPELYFYSANAYKINSKLEIIEVATHPLYQPDCSQPLKVFAEWYGIIPPEYIVTRANNMFLAPGTVYKKSLHDLIGIFDLENFCGIADFEYWSRILFNEYKGFYQSNSMWFYTRTETSISNQTEYKKNIVMLHNKIKNKYAELVEKYKYKFIGKI